MKTISRRQRRRTFSGVLWRRVIGRRGGIQGLVRPRAPLIFARRSPAPIAQAGARSIVKNEFRLALALDFSWPTWLVDARSWTAIPPAATAAPRPIRIARSPTLITRRGEPQVGVARSVPQGMKTADGSKPAPLARVGAHRAALQYGDRRPSAETMERHVLRQLVPPPPPRPLVVPRGPVVARSAPIAEPRLSTARVAPIALEPLALVRRARRSLTAESADAGPPAAMLTQRTITRTEHATEVVHHRTAFEHPVARVLRQAAESPPVSTDAAAPASRPVTPASLRPATPAPVIDVERLSDEVYRHIQRRVRIERERRGA